MINCSFRKNLGTKWPKFRINCQKTSQNIKPLDKRRKTDKQTNKQKDRQTDRQTEHSIYSLKNFQFQLITDNLFKISMALACTMNLLRCNWENDSCFDLNFMLFGGDRNILAMTKEIWANFWVCIHLWWLWWQSLN